MDPAQKLPQDQGHPGKNGEISFETKTLGALLTEEGRDVYEPPILADVICEQPISKNTASKNFGIHSPSAHLLLGERILKV